MSAFRDIMSIVGPGGAKTTTAPKSGQSQPTGATKPTPRPAAGTNGTTPAPQLKRKASGAADPSQAKVQRKDSPAQPVQYTGTARPTAAPGAARLSQPTTTTVPYRGTAAPSAKPANAVAKKPTAPASTAAAPRKATPPAPRSVPKPAPAASASTTAAPASKPKGYLALLQKAKEKDSSKPAASPVTVASKGFIPTKKERLALKAEANAAKGKKPGVAPTVKGIDVKSDLSKISRKPADVGYQGTARPAKTAAPIAYKGTARPQSTTAPSSRGGTPAAKPKPKTEKGRYDGYADWSDLDDMDDGEDDYASDGSSDMEGGMWDVEKEEQEALKMARKEDAEALAEEMRLKREKEEKKRKLMTLSKAAAAKKKY